MDESINPYAAPKTDLERPLDPRHPVLHDASAGRRLLNLIVDLVVCQVLIVGIIGGTAIVGLPLNAPFRVLISFALRIVYCIVLEGLLGRTVGKLVTGTVVVRNDGQRPSFGQIVGRTFVRYVPFEPLSFLGDAASGWHDRWSGTRVVRTRP